MVEFKLINGLKILIDKKNLTQVNTKRWTFDGRYAVNYFYEGKILKKLYLHKFLTGTNSSTIIDHANGNRLDNRLKNLRIADKSKNAANSKNRNPHGLKGITWDKKRKKWQAQIKCVENKRHLGRFNSKQEAHSAYKKAALQLFGSFARW